VLERFADASRFRLRRLLGRQMDNKRIDVASGSSRTQS
jgi:hypothetical protein